MSALNKKKFSYLPERGRYLRRSFSFAGDYYFPGTQHFLSLLNLSNILTQSSVRIIIALGVAGLIVTQGDRSFCWSSGRAGGSGGCDIIAVHG